MTITTGTEKQIAWAKDIKAAAVAQWEAAAQHWIARADKAINAGKDERAQRHAEVARRIRALAELAAECSNASVWIDGKMDPLMTSAAALSERHGAFKSYRDVMDELSIPAEFWDGTRAIMMKS